MTIYVKPASFFNEILEIFQHMANGWVLFWTLQCYYTMMGQGLVHTVSLFSSWSAPAVSSTKWSEPLDGSNSCCSELLTLLPRFIEVAPRASLISSCLRRLPWRLMLFLILILPALVKLTIPVTILDAPDLMEDLSDLYVCHKQ